MKLSNNSKQCLLVLLPIGCLLAVSVLLRLAYIHLIPFNYDEGHWLMFGLLVSLGHPAYTETFVGIPPLALLTIQLGVSLFGDALSVRYPMMIYSLIGIASIYWLVKQQSSHRPLLAGLLAAMIVAFGPRYLPLSATILAEVPALALALLSLALAQLYQQQSRYLWLALSGVAFALSLALKIYVVFLPLIIGIQLLLIAFREGKKGLSQPANYLKLVKMGLVWSGGVLAATALFGLLYNPVALYREVVLFRTALRQTTMATEDWLADNFEVFEDEVELYNPLMVSASIGLWVERRWKHLGKLWIWPVWFIVALLLLPLHAPLRGRHLVILVPPLAVLSSSALLYLMDYLSQTLKRYSPLARPAIILALAGYLLFKPIQTLASTQDHDFDADHIENLAASTFIQRTTTPDECIVVDDQRFAFQTERMAPPSLSETSEARLSVGWLTTPQIIEIAAQENCAALVMQTERFDIFIPDLRDAAASIYALDLDFRNPDTGHETTVYAVQINTDRQPTQLLNRSLGGLITLKGVDLTPGPWWAGQAATLSTYWLTEKIIDRDYKIFLHLKDAQGNVVTSFDHYPFELDTDYLAPDAALSPRYLSERGLDVFDQYPTTGLIPTPLWIPGNTLKETIILHLPETISNGNYTLNIGMYDETTLERLPIRGDTSGENAILLAEVTVQRW